MGEKMVHRSSTALIKVSSLLLDVISRLGLWNFRGVRRGEARLEPFTIILGGNNSGKTTILEAFPSAKPFPEFLILESTWLSRFSSSNTGFLKARVFFHNYTSTETKIQCDSHVISFLRNDETVYVTTNERRRPMRHA